MAQLAEIADRRANVEDAGLADIGVPADANFVDVEAIAVRRAAGHHRAPGDDGVIADAEKIGRDRDVARGDDRAAPDLGPEQAQMDIVERRPRENVRRRQLHELLGRPEAEIGEAPNRQDLRSGAPDEKPFGGDRERVEAEKQGRDDGEGARVERKRRVDSRVGPFQARLREPNAERAGQNVERRLRAAAPVVREIGGSVLGREFRFGRLERLAGVDERGRADARSGCV